MDATHKRGMDYRDLELQYELNSDEFETDAVRRQAAGKQYRTKRSPRALKRKTPKASHPGYGIAGRRNRRWAW